MGGLINAARYAKIKLVAYRCAIYSIALYLISIAQVTFFSRVNVLSATPDLLLGAVTALAIREDEKVCSICGIISGLFYSSLGGASLPFYLPFSFVCAYLLKIAAERQFGKKYISYLALSALGFGAKSLYNLVESSASASSFSLLAIIYRIVIPEFISSMIFCSISYVIINTLSQILNKRAHHRREYLK